MLRDLVAQLAGRNIPDRDIAVLPCRCTELAVQAESHGTNRGPAGLLQGLVHRLIGSPIEIPEPCLAVGRAYQTEVRRSARWRACHRAYRPRVLEEPLGPA